MLSEIREAQKEKNCIFSLIYGIWKIKLIEAGSRTVVTKVGGQGRIGKTLTTDKISVRYEE